ncbi:MAG: toxic anion resistance protein [Lachnospiraceae bacterium]|nr:toxic anion resistance protein [Lachnospiraceae bacterium]
MDATTEPEKKGIFGIFQKAKRGIDSIKANYAKAETNVSRIEKDLEKHQVVLTQDVEMFEQMHGCFVKQNGIKEFSEEDRLNYMYANMMKVGQNESWYILLQYDEADELQDVNYKKLYIEDIDKEGYDKDKLGKFADILFQNRVVDTLKKQHKKKIYPNDPCPCGSGKKYKKCCGKA